MKRRRRGSVGASAAFWQITRSLFGNGYVSLKVERNEIWDTNETSCYYLNCTVAPVALIPPTMPDP